jgi:4-amino-4-deoxy-L-arabinose transferase-like glycosyltransferase
VHDEGLESSKTLSRETIGLLLTLSLALIAYLYNLQGSLLEDDENKYIYAAWRVAEGEVPGRDFLIAQPPLFLYAGAIAVKLCGGPSLSALYALRCLSVMATIVTAVFVYLTARSIWNARAGWLATVIFLLSGQVFIHGRLFRPDMFMLTLTVASTYLFVHAVARRKRWLLVGAGFLFGAAATIKLFGFLAWGGCALYLLYRFWVKETSIRDALADLLALGAPAVAVAGVGYGLFYFYWLSPRLLEGVLGSHIRQSKPGLLLRLINPLVLYSSFIRQQFALLLLIPAVDQLRRQERSLAAVYLWQLPTALIFFFWGRSLYPRHLLYLVPTLAALMAWLLDAGLRRAENLIVQDRQPSGRLENWLLWTYRAFWTRGLTSVVTGGLLAAVVAQPLVGTILPATTRQESDILALVDYIVEHTREDAYVLAEYAGLNFFAQRRSIYYGPYISWGAASSGVLTSSQLIGEIEAKRVQMILFHAGDSLFQLNAMPDFDTFRAYVREHYDFMGTFEWGDRTFELYLAPELDREAASLRQVVMLGLANQPVRLFRVEQ